MGHLFEPLLHHAGWWHGLGLSTAHSIIRAWRYHPGALGAGRGTGSSWGCRCDGNDNTCS